MAGMATFHSNFLLVTVPAVSDHPVSQPVGRSACSILNCHLLCSRPLRNLFPYRIPTASSAGAHLDTLKAEGHTVLLIPSPVPHGCAPLSKPLTLSGLVS